MGCCSVWEERLDDDIPLSMYLSSPPPPLPPLLPPLEPPLALLAMSLILSMLFGFGGLCLCCFWRMSLSGEMQESNRPTEQELFLICSCPFS